MEKYSKHIIRKLMKCKKSIKLTIVNKYSKYNIQQNP